MTLAEEPEMRNQVKIPVEIQTEELEETIRKAEKLVSALKEAADLAREITSLGEAFRVYVKVPEKR